MLYSIFQAQSDWLSMARLAASPMAYWLKLPQAQQDGMYAARRVAAWADVFCTSAITHQRPDFRLDHVTIGTQVIKLHQQVDLKLPFADLLHFAREGGCDLPRVLVVAPLSGHFSTLLRNTVQTLLADHDVWITDWRNARDVALAEGSFDLDDYIDHSIRCIEAVGDGCHIVAVCQPTVGVLAAVSVMAQTGNACVPATMTLMAGPVDTRLNPTKVNDLAKSQPIEWFERNLISRVPLGFLGAGRAVYPGFVQLSAFVAMNPERHRNAHLAQIEHLVDGETDKVAAHQRFYDEYFAVMDLDAAFFLQTVKLVFQDHALPLGQMMYRGQVIDPSAIHRTALFTVEGELDDICAIGQTMAALDLCSGIGPLMKQHHLQSGVGHYGVFSGRRWAAEVYPKLRQFIQKFTRTPAAAIMHARG